MRILTLILLPWIVYGVLSFLGWCNTAINIAIAFVVEAIYFSVLYIWDVFFNNYEDESETALERARRVIG